VGATTAPQVCGLALLGQVSRHGRRLNIFPVHMTARMTFAAALLTECLVPIGLCRHLLRPESGRRAKPENRVVELVGEMSSSSAAVLSRRCSRR